MEISKQELPCQAVKIFFIVFVFILIAVVSYIAGILVKYRLDTRKADKSVERFQGALEEPYKNDTYGGKTPEETWAMFLDALKKGDIDLASKYYRVGDQEKERQFLQEAKDGDNLKVYLEELSAPLQEDTSLPDFILADKSRAHYFYMVKNQKTNKMHKNSIEFYFNPYTKAWKILD